MGRPIHVVRCEKPTLEQVHEVQKRYIEELLRCVESDEMKRSRMN